MQRRRTVCGQLAKDRRGFDCRVARHLQAVAGDPARNRDRGVRADPFEAALHRLFHHLPRSTRLPDGLCEHLIAAGNHGLAQLAKVIWSLARLVCHLSPRSQSVAGASLSALEHRA